MKNRPDSFTKSLSETSHFFSETVGPGCGNRITTDRGHRLSLVLCIVAAVLFLGTAGCSDSSSDDLALTDAVWVAFQDGDGPWREFEIPQDMIFDTEELVTDPDGRYSLAMVFARAARDADDNGFVQEVTLKTTTAEVPRIDFSMLSDAGGTSLEVTLDDDSLNYGSAYLYVGGEDEMPWNTNTVTLYPYTAPYDLVATLHSSGLDYPSKIFVQTFDESSQGQAETLDLAFGEFEDLSEPHTVTFTPSAADEILYNGEVYLVTANGTAASLGEEYNEEAEFFEYTAPAALPPEGSYVLELSIDLDDDSSVLHYQGFVAPGDLEIDGTNLPYVFDGRHVADTSTGSLLPGVSWTVVDDMDDVAAYASIFNGEANRIDYYVTTLVTAGRVGTDTGIATPDLRSAPGWYPLWSVPASTETWNAGSWAVLASGDINDLFESNLGMLNQGGCPRLGDASRVTVIKNWEWGGAPL